MSLGTCNLLFLALCEELDIHDCTYSIEEIIVPQGAHFSLTFEDWHGEGGTLTHALAILMAQMVK